MQESKTIQKQKIVQQHFEGERALFASQNLTVIDSVFGEGESPLKESRDIDLVGCLFRWKYPLWYCENVTVRNSVWFEMARAGVWYSRGVSISDSQIEAPKNFRRCDGLSLTDVTLTNAQETLWSCRNVSLKNVTARGDYFAMNCENVEVDGLILHGNYSFDGAKNVTIRNSRLLTKDAFWNSENVTVCDSVICGEYLGWNAKNLTLVNCTVESLQGMCYIENLVMRDCKLIETTRAFEYSSVDASIASRIDGVFNPSSGVIRAKEIGELVLDPAFVDPQKTEIVCAP